MIKVNKIEVMAYSGSKPGKTGRVDAMVDSPETRSQSEFVPKGIEVKVSETQINSGKFYLCIWFFHSGVPFYVVVCFDMVYALWGPILICRYMF